MNEEQFEKTERYVHEKMSRQERLQFEAELLNNQELAADMEAYRMIEEEMEGYDQEAALKASLQNIGTRFISENETLPEQPPTKTIPVTPPVHAHLKESSYWKRWTVAAAIIVVVIASAGLYYFVRQKNSSAAGVATINEKKDSAPVISRTDTASASHPKAQPPAIIQRDTPQEINSSNADKKKATASLPPAVLFAQYFTPDPTPEDKTGPLEDAFDYYENKNYPDAISAVNDAELDFVTRGQQTPPELTKWYAHYYKGICYLAIDSAAKAIPELEQAVNHPTDSLLQVKAQWYLALGYLKENKVQQATGLLRQIVSNRSSKTYHTKATLLLRKLGKGE